MSYSIILFMHLFFIIIFLYITWTLKVFDNFSKL